ncbi:MAG TPA: TraR/DksA C4-type zinc finger protein [Cytophagaceae bacterium]|nr:TraR/DksA C4-type zinc finger protein [Cytophagaceae bacterium]
MKRSSISTTTSFHGIVLRTGRRPQAIINKTKIETEDMGEEKLRYSEEELKEFEVLILEKLDKAKKELNYMKEMLSKKNDEGTDNTAGTMKLLEDGADTLEKENFSQLAVRQQKFVTQLENAMARIKNGTYGICIDTGKLIPKERLKAVPHTQHSIEAKLNRRD